METMEIEVLSAAEAWVRQGQGVLMATVVTTWGSSPRPIGSLFVVAADGRSAGSVSGGCIEDGIIESIRTDGFVGSYPRIVRYGVDAEEANRFGLPCGGTIELVMELLNDVRSVTAMVYELRNRRTVLRRLDMETGQVTLDMAHVTDKVSFDGRHLLTVHGPSYRLLIIGAGQLSYYVSMGAIALGFSVTVCDPRVEYADQWAVDGALLVRTMPDDTVLEMQLDARSAVLGLTHDPKLDDLALMEALKTPAFYVGAIGSRKHSAARRERLKLFGITDQEVAHLKGPVGLFIGSKTPPEIALSILAQLVACKYRISATTPMDVEVGKRLLESADIVDSDHR